MSNPIQAATFADVNGDGHLEVLVASTSGAVYVLDRNGRDVKNFPFYTQATALPPAQQSGFIDIDRSLQIAELDCAAQRPIPGRWQAVAYIVSPPKINLGNRISMVRKFYIIFDWFRGCCLYVFVTAQAIVPSSLPQSTLCVGESDFARTCNKAAPWDKPAIGGSFL